MKRIHRSSQGLAASALAISVAALFGNGVHAEEAAFHALGFLDPSQPYSTAYGVSDDGAVVALTSFQDGSKGARWTKEGIAVLPPLPGTASSSAGFISADGSVIVGRSVIGCCTTRSTMWSAADGWQPVWLGPNLAGADFTSQLNDHALGISGDGTVAIGQSATGLADAGAYHPYRWNAEQGMESLVEPKDEASTFGAARAVSYDGFFIVGWYRQEGSGQMRAFRWSEAEGVVALGTLGGNSEARAITRDGSIVVGDSSVVGSGRTAFRWTEAGGLESLGQWVGFGGSQNTVPLAVNGDGSIFVGYGMIFAGTWNHEAIIWDEINGWRHLATVLLEEHGLDLAGWTLTEARAISPDGRFIVGEGINPFGQTEAWLVEMPYAICPEDLTGCGSVGVPDLLMLLATWGECPRPTEPSGECAGSCGGMVPSGCWCDDQCHSAGDCCEDVCDGCSDLPECPTLPGSQCPADLNGDGSVGVPDLLELLAAWGSCT